MRTNNFKGKRVGWARAQFKVVKNPDRLSHVPNAELTDIDNTKLGVPRKGVASLPLQEKLVWSIQDEYITSAKGLQPISWSHRTKKKESASEASSFDTPQSLLSHKSDEPRKRIRLRTSHSPQKVPWPMRMLGEGNHLANNNSCRIQLLIFKNV
jgi:hypothetical protein